jgi:hypothetical protein
LIASTLSSKITSINKLLMRKKQTANKLQFVFLGLNQSDGVAKLKSKLGVGNL